MWEWSQFSDCPWCPEGGWWVVLAALPWKYEMPTFIDAGWTFADIELRAVKIEAIEKRANELYGLFAQGL